MILINPQIDGVVRSVLQFAAGFLVSGGYIQLSDVGNVVTALVTVATVIWSIASKKKAAPAA